MMKLTIGKKSLYHVFAQGPVNIFAKNVSKTGGQTEVLLDPLLTARRVILNITSRKTEKWTNFRKVRFACYPQLGLVDGAIFATWFSLIFS
eukprot:UN22041